uniref:Uncharacterized protein n=1 Tax=Glossina brevipalpis TaxID=37001 RepID=A0A1A9WUW5_9MUSC
MANAQNSIRRICTTTLPRRFVVDDDDDDRIKTRKRRRWHSNTPFYGSAKFMLLVLLLFASCMMFLWSPVAAEVNSSANDDNENNDHNYEVDNVGGNNKNNKNHTSNKNSINDHDHDLDKAILETSAVVVGNGVSGEEGDHNNANDFYGATIGKTEVLEMRQHHTLRHQEHYKQRIEQAVNDFKHLTEDASSSSPALTSNSRRLRYQQIQAALQEPSPTHHRRHEQHLLQQEQLHVPLSKCDHHLRHENHHQQQHLWPLMRHQRHQRWNSLYPKTAIVNFTQTNTATTTARTQLMSSAKPHSGIELDVVVNDDDDDDIITNENKTSQRLFDRESLYIKHTLPSWTPTTNAPHLRHSSHKKAEFLRKHSINEKEHQLEKTSDESQLRFSLPLNIMDNDENNLDDFKSKIFNDYTNNEEHNDDDENDDDSDYSYEDSDEELQKKSVKKYLKSPSEFKKISVKRYTNPLRDLYRSSNHQRYNFKPQQQRSYLEESFDEENNNNNNQNGNEGEDNENNRIYGSDNDKDVDNDRGDNGDDSKFSDEKWNKIEHEHYRKQLQHQRTMQALRSRHSNGSNVNNKNINPVKNNKFPISQASSSSYNTEAKRQILDDTLKQPNMVCATDH